MKRISVTLPDAMYDQLEQLALAQRRSVSAQGGLLIEERLYALAPAPQSITGQPQRTGTGHCAEPAVSADP